MADVMDVEEAGVFDCFVAAGSELQCTQVAPEADAFTFATIASHLGVTPVAAAFQTSPPWFIRGGYLFGEAIRAHFRQWHLMKKTADAANLSRSHVFSLTTVGYGDLYPTSDVGRAIAMLSSLMGIAIVALPASILTTGLMEEIGEGHGDDGDKLAGRRGWRG